MQRLRMNGPIPPLYAFLPFRDKKKLINLISYLAELVLRRA